MWGEGRGDNWLNSNEEMNYDLCLNFGDGGRGRNVARNSLHSFHTCRWRRKRDGKRQEMEEISGFETKNLNSLVKVYC